MLNKKHHFTFNELLLFFFISLIIILFSPSLFERLENDSYSYINNENIRLSLYPLLIDIFNTNYEYLVTLQIFTLALSISFLALSICSFGVNKIITFLFLIIISLNLYYTSFSKSILTEAIYCSFINFSIGLFLIRERIKDSSLIIFLMGFFIGGIMAIKPEGIIITLTLSTCYLLKQTINKKKVIFLISVLLLPMTESLIFYNLHDKRGSVLEKSIMGKIFILSAYSQPKYEEVKDTNNLRNIITEKSKPTKLYLENISNLFLKYNLRSDYEVVGQYQLREILGEKKDILIELEDNKLDIFKNLLLENPINFIGLVASNYLAMWMPGGKQIFFSEYKKNNPIPPYLNLLEKSSGKIMPINKDLLLTVMILFLIMFTVYIYSTFSSFYELLILKVNNNFDLNIITLLINFQLLVISTINIASPRYLMPFFPIIILIILIRLNKVYRKSNVF